MKISSNTNKRTKFEHSFVIPYYILEIDINIMELMHLKLLIIMSNQLNVYEYDP